MLAAFKHSMLVTGGTQGLGYYTALEIARQHNLKFLKLDLSSLTAVRKFRQTWEENNLPPISALVFNAALQFPGEIEYTEDGFEKTYGISHVGHSLLFALLHPYLADEARVVITSSGTHDPAQKTGLPDAVYRSAGNLAHPPAKLGNGPGRQHYSNTKLSNVLYTYALNRRFNKINRKSGKHWAVTAFDPGLMPGTGLARDATPLERFLWYWILPHIIPLLRMLFSENVHSPQDSGGVFGEAGGGDDVKGVSGVYFEGRREIKSSQDSYVESKQEDLWIWTVNTIASDEEEKINFALEDLL